MFTNPYSTCSHIRTAIHRHGRGPLKTQLKTAWFHADQLNILGLGAVWQ